MDNLRAGAMIKIVSHFSVKENCLEEVLEIFEDIIDKTRCSDSGFTEYDLFRNAADPLHLMIVETWDSREALDAHSAHDYVKSMGTRIQPYVDDISFGFYQKIK